MLDGMNMVVRNSMGVFVALALALLFTACDEAVIDAHEFGYYQSLGPICRNLTATGIGSANDECRSFYQWHIPDRRIVSAHLEFSIVRYLSNDPIECFTVHAVDLDDLPDHSIENYEALGEGSVITAACIGAEDLDTTITIAFGPRGVRYFNRRRGRVAGISTVMATLSDTASADEWQIFNTAARRISRDYTHRLVLRFAPSRR